MERNWGIAAGLAWSEVAEAHVVYVDRGISPGMQRGIDRARALGREVELRVIERPFKAVLLNAPVGGRSACSTS